MAVLKNRNAIWTYYRVFNKTSLFNKTSSIVNHSERKCNVQEPQLSLIAYNHIFISIILQGRYSVTSNFLNSEAVLRGY
jgi:hypothetical protein